MSGTIDKDALKRKYAEERDKRLRPDGNDQYLEVKGQLAHYLDDPYVPVADASRRARPRRPSPSSAAASPVWSPVRGWARPASSDVRIIDKGGDFGGTWYWNRYPGAQCDTASFVYMPLLEETGHMPTREVRARARDPRALPAHRRAVRPVRRRAASTPRSPTLDWDESAARWIVRTNRGDEFTAQFVGMGTGPLHVPEAAGHRGIETFEGHSLPHQPLGLRLHRRRSDGRTDGGPRATSGWRSSAPAPPRCSACRTSPAHAKELYVFQRTPSLGRRARQRADRSRVVRRDRHARLAAALARQLHRQPDRRVRPTRTW